jgi:ABC-type multidrug transport system permease subunit
LTAGSYALIIGALVSDRQVAMTLTPLVVTPLMLFAGFFIQQDSIPPYLYEFEYISFFKYGFQALELVTYLN